MVHDADFTKFNREAAITALDATYPKSVVNYVLKAGLECRVFNLLKIDEPDVLNNVFKTIFK